MSDAGSDQVMDQVVLIATQAVDSSMRGMLQIARQCLDQASEVERLRDELAKSETSRTILYTIAQGLLQCGGPKLTDKDRSEWQKLATRLEGKR